MKKLLLGAAALATAGLPIAASADPYFHSRDGWNEGRYESYRGYDGYDRGYYDRGYYDSDGWRRHDDDGRGAAMAAGLFGLVLGAALADSAHHHHYHHYDYGYRGYGYGW